jgi:predicted outer membrane protein
MAHAHPIQIKQYPKGVDYPATRAPFIERARNLGADDSVCASLAQLPDDDFQTPAAVSHAFKGPPGRELHGGNAVLSRSALDQGNNAFLIQLTEDSLAQMELCMLALGNSNNDTLKAFAQTMLNEHGKFGQQLEQLAQSMQLAFPKKMRRQHVAMIRAIRMLKGKDFDTRFVDENVKYHENDLKVLNHYVSQAGDEVVRKLAQAGATLFEKHLAMARQLQSD